MLLQQLIFNKKEIYVGGIIGGLIVFYLLGKAVEWAILKHFVKGYGTMAWISSIAVFCAVFVLWWTQRNEVHAFHPAMFVDYIVAAILLPFARIIWRKRSEAKASRSAD